LPVYPGAEGDILLGGSREGKEGRAVLVGLILVSVTLAALAQLTLKHGMNQVTLNGANPLRLGSLAEVVLSAAVWLVVLSRASLSFAYPFASLTYVLILVFDRFVLDQSLSGFQYGGVALIIAGILLISRVHQTG
jgi:drug/metabolite transporter (DMT)-like permease